MSRLVVKHLQRSEIASWVAPWQAYGWGQRNACYVTHEAHKCTSCQFLYATMMQLPHALHNEPVRDT